MTNKAHGEFAKLASKLKDKVIVRIIDESTELAVMHILTAVNSASRSSVYEEEKLSISCASYRCDFFEKNNNLKQQSLSISNILVEGKGNVSVKNNIISIAKKSVSDVSITHIDVDGTESTQDRLYLFHLLHLARMQGMIASQCLFLTPFDGRSHLVLANRIGGLLNKHMQELQKAIMVIRQL